MMTKKEFCESYINRFCKENDVERSKANDYVYSDTTLGVCLEHLGELHENDKEYLSCRGGIFYTVPIFDEEGNFQDIKSISARDLISLLPD